MSKKDFSNTDDIMTSFFSQQPNKEEVVEKETAKETRKEESRTAKDSTYSICIKVNDDLVDFFKNNLWITRKTKKDYLNDLIRQDYLHTIGARKNATDEEIKELWEKYKKQHNL